MKKRIGLFFGSFDPIHIGHVNVATSILNLNLVDEVQLVIAYSNPWKTNQTEFIDRYAMCRLAVKDIPKIMVSMKEKTVFDKYGITCTYKVIEEFKSAYNYEDFEIVIITTQETYAEIPQWKNGKEILENNKFIIITSEHFGDVKFDIGVNDILVDVKDIPIHSSTIRDMVKAKQILSPFVDKDVIDYISQSNLYQ